MARPDACWQLKISNIKAAALGLRWMYMHAKAHNLDISGLLGSLGARFNRSEGTMLRAHRYVILIAEEELQSQSLVYLKKG